MTRIGLLLGKPPARSPVLPDVLAELARHAAVVVHVPADADDLPTWSTDVDLVVARGLDRAVLRRLAGPVGRDVRFCDAPRDLLAVRDRDRVHGRLHADGLRVPAHRVVATWPQAAAAAAGGGVVVKQVAGDVGRGRRVLVGSVASPSTAPFPGPYLLEDRVEVTGPEVKLYHLGARVAAVVLDPDGTARDLGDEVDPELALLANRAAAACGLTLCGVDVLPSPDGPVVVDVNAFPSARRVAGAAGAIARHLLATATTPADRDDARRPEGPGPEVAASATRPPTEVAP